MVIWLIEGRTYLNKSDKYFIIETIFNGKHRGYLKESIDYYERLYGSLYHTDDIRDAKHFKTVEDAEKSIKCILKKSPSRMIEVKTGHHKLDRPLLSSLLFGSQSGIGSFKIIEVVFTVISYI